MKNIKKTRNYIAFIVLALLALLPLFLPTVRAAADFDTDDYYNYNSNPYSFTITDFDVTYDIAADRTMQVTEEVTIHFTGRESTGIMRDIPVNAGDRVTNIRVYNGDGSDAVYDVYMEYEDFITVDIGDYSNKTGKTFTYVIEYGYAITQPRDKNAIYLNAVGFGSEATIENADITLKLPDGLVNAVYYVGNSSTPVPIAPVNGVITLNQTNLDAYRGVTFDLIFGDGVLSTRFDYTPLIVFLVACAVVAVIVVLKFFVFNKGKLTPVVNFTAPDDMDPLEMGKLIDNKVDPEDVTSLIYYWANKGYLAINMDDEDDPMLIRIRTKLPQGAPDYQIRMYDKLFARGDEVKISSLSGNFYSTVDTVTRQVNARHTQLYDKKSVAVSAIFAVIGALITGLTAIILPMKNISLQFFSLSPLLVILPTVIVWAGTSAIFYQSEKLKKSTRILLYAAVGVGSVLLSLLGSFLISDVKMEFAAKMVAQLSGYAIAMLSVTLINRTEQYTAQLNQIVGFRNFILYTEKDKLEAMLEEDPQLYYGILPYAQVLGVSDIWEKKFEGLTVAPPQWMNGGMNAYVNFVVINSVIHNTTMLMTNNFRSRPAPSGASGGGHGGFGGGGSFGGHGGGGHGGGGFRGR